MGCDSIATTISRMGKEPTTLGPEDLKGHRFSAFWLRLVRSTGSGPFIVQQLRKNQLKFLLLFFQAQVQVLFDLVGVLIFFRCVASRAPHGGGRARQR